MRAWNDIPIQRKLTGVIVLTSTASLALACSAFILFERSEFRGRMVGELSAQASMIGANSTAALTFNDPKSTEETLRALAFVRSVELAVIFTPAGKSFGIYRSSGTSLEATLPFAEEGERFEANRLLLWRSITLAGKKIGVIGLSAGLGEMKRRHTTYLGIAVLILVTGLSAATLIASALQTIVSRPLLSLAETARRVYTEKDFSIREQRSGEDEVGVLVRQFNFMLEQIEERDEALRHAHDELEERVRNRTWELTEEVARHEATHLELIAANQAKSSFLASVTHELRTPLTSIIWSSEMLEEEFQDEGLERFGPDLQKIARAGKNLLAIVTDILDLSKLEAGRMELEPAPFLLNDVVREVVQTATPLAAKNGNKLEVDYAPSNGIVVDNDEQKFTQSLLNLVSNACKFTSQGVVAVSVEQSTEAGSEMLAVSVSDTGIGIPAGRISKLFQPFTQLDSRESRKFAGTGLGLVISQRFCHLMGGRIEVESEAGKGSRFTIKIPRAVAKDREEEQ